MTTKDVDVLIIGSGPGGGVMARQLAGQNLHVLVVEAGPETTADSYTLREVDAVQYYQEGSMRMTADKGTQIVQGRIVGGGSLLYASVSQVPPKEILDTWKTQYGLDGFSFDEMLPHYRTMGQVLNRTAHDQPQYWNDNNRIFWSAMQAHQLQHNIVHRFVKNCVGCGFCYLGCKFNRKETAVDLLSEARKKGVELIANCQINEITYHDDMNRVSGAVGVISKAPERSVANRYPEGPIQIKARLVIVCGGAFNTPYLLLKSPVQRYLSPTLGKYLIMQSAMTNTIIMPFPVKMVYGLPETTSLTHYRVSHGFHLKCANHHPVSFSSDLPGFGEQYKKDMESFGRALQWELIGYDKPLATNRVTIDLKGNMKINYDYSDEYRDRLLYGLKVTARLALDAPVSAEKIFISATKEGFVTAADLPNLDEVINARYWIPHKVDLRTAHPQGGCRMGRNATEGVVDSRGRAFGLPNLIVADTSVNPTSTYGHPSFTAYAVAHKIATETQKDLSALLQI